MSQIVRAYYNENVEREWQRLDTPLCKIEFLSMLRLIEKYFPKNGCVCDIGSGPGRYALEFARRGYKVTLFDFSEKLLDRARSAFAEFGFSAEQFIQGDARDMRRLETEAFDAALLLEPLIHIINAGERASVPQQLHRVLKPGGVAIVSYLNSWG